MNAIYDSPCPKIMGYSETVSRSQKPAIESNVGYGSNLPLDVSRLTLRLHLQPKRCFNGDDCFVQGEAQQTYGAQRSCPS